MEGRRKGGRETAGGRDIAHMGYAWTRGERGMGNRGRGARSADCVRDMSSGITEKGWEGFLLRFWARQERMSHRSSMSAAKPLIRTRQQWFAFKQRLWCPFKTL